MLLFREVTMPIGTFIAFSFCKAATIPGYGRALSEILVNSAHHCACMASALGYPKVFRTSRLLRPKCCFR